jgi:hypothetical protein
MEEYKNRTSLLKQSIVELNMEKNQWKSPSYDVNSRLFRSKTWHFAFFKAHHFSFSTGWDIICTLPFTEEPVLSHQII